MTGPIGISGHTRLAKMLKIKLKINIITPTAISASRIQKPKIREIILPPKACNFTPIGACLVSTASCRKGANSVLSRSPIEKNVMIRMARTTNSCRSAQAQPREYHHPIRSSNNISLLYHPRRLPTRGKACYNGR